MIQTSEIPTKESELRNYYLNGGTDLNFSLIRGTKEANYFFRRGSNQSHTVLYSGSHAHIVTAFVAGNSSIAFWPDAPSEDLTFKMIKGPEGLETVEGEHGVRYTIGVNNTHLTLNLVQGGSTRDIRDFEHDGVIYNDSLVTPKLLGPQSIVFERRRLDGGGRYYAQLTLNNGTVEILGDGKIVFNSKEGLLEITVDALTSERQEPPARATDIFTREVIERLAIEDLQAAMYLMLDRKSLAGSWRYQTDFGRDPKETKQIAADFLSAKTLEAELTAKFERLAEDGDASHEEAIGDIATRININAGRGAVSTPVYDYKMIDTVYMLSNLFMAYLKKVDTETAASFLNNKTGGGRTYREALRANLDLVLDRAEPFANNPVFQNLIAFKDGLSVGDWRDSNCGHGARTDQEEFKLQADGTECVHRSMEGGRYAFGVNVGLVPSAVRNARDLFANESLGLRDDQRAGRALKIFEVWDKNVRKFYRQSARKEDATRAAQNYYTKLCLPAPPAIERDIVYSALSLDRHGNPIKAIHSDTSFDLFYNDPPEDALNEVADSLLRPAPYGLMIPGIGMAIKTPFLIEDPVVRERFNPDTYHGYLVWGWQMAKMERALHKQLKREDLSPATRLNLRRAHEALWAMLDTVKPHLKEELWGWEVKDGRIVYKAFREANALQFWNLALLLLENPYAKLLNVGA